MQGSSIATECIQETFESSRNAAAKGLSQFFTPVWFGHQLARGMPYHRPVIVDLSCGNGQLASSCANQNTVKFLGCDLDPCRWMDEKRLRKELNEASDDHKAGDSLGNLNHHKGVADITKLYQLLKEVGFSSDFFALNPPWDVHFYRDRLQALAESENEAVRIAFQSHDGRTTNDTIDSTVAVTLMSIDLMTDYGEAFLIGNEATLQRLIFGPNAPHGSIKKHIWAHLSYLGNPMTGIQDCSFHKGEQFRTGVIYYAKGHEDGVKFEQLDIPSRGHLAQVCEQLFQHRDEYNRSWHKVRNTWQTNADDAINRWLAASGEYDMRQKANRSDWNIWLDAGGIIKVNLSLYDRHSVKINKGLAKSLFELSDKRPMQLVLQRNQRRELEQAVFDSPWRVHPALQDAVKDAVRSYHSERAPLYPLPKIQRLGYLDESDSIKCLRSFGNSGLFLEGKSYTLETRTYKVTRRTTKMNLEGEQESIELSGSELCFSLKAEDGEDYTFMDGYLQTAEGVSIEHFWQNNGRPHFTLQQLVDHFDIPEVPDVASLHQEVYQRNKETLTRIFAALNG